MNLTDKRILVTGGSGFLGRHVCTALSARGCRSVVAPRKADYDLTHEPDVRRLFAERAPEVVSHLAAVVGGIGANRSSPGRFFRAGLRRTIDWSRAHRAERTTVGV